MPQPPTVISVADVRNRGIRLTPEEAVAIVFQLGHRLSWQLAPPPPPAILLQSDGRVDVRWPHEADRPTAAAFAQLLHELLPEPGADRSHVPGGLRLLVARALGDTVLPPIVSGPEFASALHRFLGEDGPEGVTAAVAGIVRRTAATPPLATACRAASERRASGPSVTELRRQLQEADLAHYSLLARLDTRAADRESRRTAVRSIDRGSPPRARVTPSASESAIARVDRAVRAGRMRVVPKWRPRTVVPVAATAAAGTALAIGLASVPAPTPPPHPPAPAVRHAQALPMLPVPIDLLASDVPAVEPPPDSGAEVQRVRQVASPQETRKPAKKSQPNKFLRFVKSLFKA